MIARDALYTFIENTIEAAEPSDALFEAVSFRNVIGSIDSALKVVRVDVVAGTMTVAEDDPCKEQGVEFTIQTWVTPEKDDDETYLDAAIDTSFDMARELFDALYGNQSLSGLVEIADAGVFETSFANLGTIRRGVTYLDGTVNPLGRG